MPETKEQSVNTMLSTLNRMIFGEDSRMELRYVNFADVREQDINANVMPTGMFNALVNNIRQNKALESIPLMATREGSDIIEVVSGHHRTRAAMQAGIEGGVVILYKGLTNAEIRAKQLAHNSIAGQSDPEIVKQLFSQIDDIGLQMESFIDPEMFANLPTAVSFQMVDIDPTADAKTMTVVFLPTQLADFSKSMDLLSSQPDVVVLEKLDAFEGFKTAVHAVKEELEIVSYPTALAAMARLAVERLAQLKVERDAQRAEATLTGTKPPLAIPAARIDPDVLAVFGAD